MGKHPRYVRKTVRHAHYFGEKNGRKKRKAEREAREAEEGSLHVVIKQDVAEISALAELLLLQALIENLELLDELLSEEGE